MSSTGSVTLTPEQVKTVRASLFAAKFALEQDVEGREKNEAITRINEALDLVRNK